MSAFIEIVTANLGQAFLSQVPHLIANFLISFAILKKLLANLLRNIAIFHSRLKVPHFLLDFPSWLQNVFILYSIKYITFACKISPYNPNDKMPMVF